MPAPEPQELAEFIDDAMAEKLKALAHVKRRIRRRNRNLLTVLFVLYIPSTCIATAWFATDDTTAQLVPLQAALTPLVTLAFFALIYLYLRHRFVTEDIPFEYVPDMVGPVVQYIDPRLNYYSRGAIQKADLEHSGLVPTPVADVRCTHGFKGTIRSMEMRLGYVETTGFAGLLGVVEYAEEVAKRREQPASDTLDVALRDNRIYMAIPQKDYFEQPKELELTDTSHLHQVGGEVSEILGVAEGRE